MPAAISKSSRWVAMRLAYSTSSRLNEGRCRPSPVGLRPTGVATQPSI